MPLQNNCQPHSSEPFNMSQIIQDLGIEPWFHAYSPTTRRHVELRHNAIFDALVDLYRPVFQFHWRHLKHLVEYNHKRANYDKDPETYAAAVYISGWFHDLYVSNRMACRDLPDNKGYRTYYLELVHNCATIKYDKFLTLLSQQIRPTKVKYAHGEALFIPIISSKLDSNEKDGNYIGIDGWVSDEACLFGLVQILEDCNLLPMHSLPDEIYGLPAWLFDWHADGLAYTWFPLEGNFTRDDIVVAFVLGEACTSTLAIGDYDEWQDFPGNEIPAKVSPTQFSRVRPVSYPCAQVVRTVETRQWKPSKEMIQLMLIEEGKGKKKRKQDEGTLVDASGIAQFRVVDWMYNACVITHIDEYSRVEIFWKIIRPG